jgi:hypothetical protein
MISYHIDTGADSNGSKQVEYVLGSHPDAPVADRLSDLVLDGCPMNVDAPSVSIPVLGLYPFQPKNARHDRITSGRIRDQNFAGWSAIFEHHSQRSTIADFLCNR